MSPRQLTRTKVKNTPTAVTNLVKSVNKQEVTVQQSQALVQVAIHAAFSSIAFLRDLFENEAFRLKSAQELLNTRDYKDYVKTAQRLSTAPNNDPGRVGYHTLIRGKNATVDALLDQLQNAYYALDKKVLAAMVFNICLDDKRPQDVVESYVFTISYRVNAQGSRIVEDIALNGVPGVVTFGDKKQSLCDMLKQVGEQMKDKPRLPAQRYIHLRLHYNDDFEPEMRIPGFRTDDSGYGQAEAIGWKRVTHAPRSMVYDAGFQGMSLTWSRLQPTEESGLADCFDTDMPAQGITYKKGSSKHLIDENIDQQIDEVRKTERRLSSTQSAEARLPTRSLPQTSLPLASPLASQLHSQMSTQHREDFTSSRQLDNVINLQPVVTNDGETQILGTSSTAGVSEPQAMPPTMKIEFKSISNQAELNYLRAKAQEREHAPPDGQVRCECGCNAEGHDVRECQICEFRQHTVCYGYLTTEDPRMPDVQICYTCLLADEEDVLLDRLKELALRRKVARVILDVDCKSEFDVRKAIGRDMQTIKAACDKLIADGYVVRSKKKDAQSIRHVESMLPQLKEKLFDPTALITHHLRVPTITQPLDTLIDYTIAPPPATIPKTPASANKRKSPSVVDDLSTPLSKRGRVKTDRGTVLNNHRIYEDCAESPDLDELDEL